MIDSEWNYRFDMNKVSVDIHDRNTGHVTGQKSVRLMVDRIFEIEI